MRVVFDTNVLVAGIVFPGGQGSRALRRVVEGKDKLFLSKPILAELLDVLSRKFDRDVEALARTAVFLSDLAESVEPEIQLEVLTDEPDNRILECALAVNADAIVTGDKAMLSLGENQGTSIISLADYLAE